MAGYYADIDSGYYKVWSDNYSEQYAGIMMHGGYAYKILEDAGGRRKYYIGTDWWAWTGRDGSIVYFDNAIPRLPDGLTFDSANVATSSFVNSGYAFTIKISSILLDTTTVSTSFGTFSACAHIRQYTTQQYVSGQEFKDTLDSWYAKGIGEIKQAIPSGAAHVLKRAFVNGRQWGDTVSVATVAVRAPGTVPGQNNIQFGIYPIGAHEVAEQTHAWKRE